MHPST
jgi:hypothetical protein